MCYDDESATFHVIITLNKNRGGEYCPPQNYVYCLIIVKISCASETPICGNSS